MCSDDDSLHDIPCSLVHLHGQLDPRKLLTACLYITIRDPNMSNFLGRTSEVILALVWLFVIPGSNRLYTDAQTFHEQVERVLSTMESLPVTRNFITRHDGNCETDNFLRYEESCKCLESMTDCPQLAACLNNFLGLSEYIPQLNRLMNDVMRTSADERDRIFIEETNQTLNDLLEEIRIWFPNERDRLSTKYAHRWQTMTCREEFVTYAPVQAETSPINVHCNGESADQPGAKFVEVYIPWKDEMEAAIIDLEAVTDGTTATDVGELLRECRLNRKRAKGRTRRRRSQRSEDAREVAGDNSKIPLDASGAIQESMEDSEEGTT